MSMIGKRMAGAIAVLAFVLAACSSGSGSATQAPATQAPAAASGGTVEVKAIAGQNLIVAGSNQMTVYTFAKDTANSGKSACSGGCLATWPALTVPAGT